MLDSVNLETFYTHKSRAASENVQADQPMETFP